MWVLYQLALGALILLAGPFLLIRRGRHYFESLPGRLGRFDGPIIEGPLWIHAVSVGEVAVAATLIDALPEIPILLTTITPTGQARARQLLGNRATIAYLPFDLGFALRRFFHQFSPAALVLVEGDYWPLLLHRARSRGLPIMVVNGRVGDTTARRFARWPGIARWLTGAVDAFGLQSQGDADRLAVAGLPAERLTVTGNLKFESPAPSLNNDLERWVRRLASDRPILVAGSTMPGEEEAALAALDLAGGGDRALLVLAPRHPERWPAVAALLDRQGRAWLARSRPRDEPRPAVVLLDSLGELADLYRYARGAFVGGTLVPTGGHNPLEPARFGTPVVVGPSLENFRDMARAFDQRSAWRRVRDSNSLGAVWKAWLDDGDEARRLGELGRALVEDNQGGVRRTVELLAPLLAAVEGV